MLTYRIAFMVAFLSTSSFATAQSSRGVQPQGGHQSPAGAEVVLDMRWIAVPENFVERVVNPGLKKLPDIGCQAVFDQQLGEQLVAAAEGDRASNVKPIWSDRLLGGNAIPMPQFRPNDEVQRTGSIMARALGDERAVRIEVSWIQRKDGNASPHVSVVPAGSHLLIRTHDSFEMLPLFSDSFGDRLFDWLGYGQPRVVGLRKENFQVFLLITPRTPSAAQEARVTETR